MLRFQPQKTMKNVKSKHDSGNSRATVKKKLGLHRSLATIAFFQIKKESQIQGLRKFSFD